MARSPFAPIPMPESPMDAFMKGATTSQSIIDSMINNKLTPYRQSLMEAQAEQARGIGAKSNLIAKFLNQFVGGGQMPAEQMATGNETQGAGGAPMGAPQGGPSNPNMNASLLASGLLNLPTQTVEGNIVTPFGTFKVGESNKEKRLGEAQSGATKKALEDIYGTDEGDAEILDSLKGLQGAINNPRYKNIAGTAEGYTMGLRPFGLPLGTAFQKLFPEEDKELLGTVNTAMASINSNFAKSFKGPYKGAIDNLIQGLKPNINESIPVQQGKVNAMMTLYTIKQQRKQLIDQYVANGASVPQAMQFADAQVPFDKIQKQVKAAQLQGTMQAMQAATQGNAQAAPMAPMEQAAPNEPQDRGGGAQMVNTPTATTGMVEIYSPEGKLVARGTRENAAKFLKEHKGHYQKVVS